MASTSGSTPAVEDGEMGRKRKRSAAGGESTAAVSKWRTRREHEIYSSKLLEALRLVRAGSSSSSSSANTAAAATPPRSKAVREAADRALAVAARGRTCWSRAILANRRRRLQAARRARLRNPASPPSRHAPAPAAVGSAQGDASKTPPLARKAKVLGRLVPGCRKLPFPALLAEASDYIAALEMQVRAMTALAEALSAVSSSSSPSGGGGSSSPPA